MACVHMTEFNGENDVTIGTIKEETGLSYSEVTGGNTWLLF